MKVYMVILKPLGNDKSLDRLDLKRSCLIIGNSTVSFRVCISLSRPPISFQVTYGQNYTLQLTNLSIIMQVFATGIRVHYASGRGRFSFLSFNIEENFSHQELFAE